MRLRTALTLFCLLYTMERGEGLMFLSDLPEWQKKLLFNRLTDKLVDLLLRYLNATKGGDD